MSRQEHREQVRHDLHQMEMLCYQAPKLFRFVPRIDAAGEATRYEVSVNVTSIVMLSNIGVPRFHHNFHLEIELPNAYPTHAAPHCRIYPAPYHPHVKRPLAWFSDGYGVWLEPRVFRGGTNGQVCEGLGHFVLRITRSLRFEERFIISNAAQIGNKEALTWYLHWRTFFQRDRKSWFPTDIAALPEATHLAQNAQAVQPASQAKIFSIQSGKRTDPIDPALQTVPEKHPVHETPLSVPNSEARKTFQIIESSPPYTPTAGILPTVRQGKPSDFRGKNQSHRLYLRPRAFQSIQQHIGWGRLTANNQVEQGGLLLGNVLYDAKRDILFGLVEEAIPGEAATGTSAYLEMNHATWKQMIDRVDAMLDANPALSLQIIGWYHTHPNQLDVFMSGTDTATQRTTFAHDWQFAVVLNPHKKIWRVFYGAESEECRGVMVEG